MKSVLKQTKDEIYVGSNFVSMPTKAFDIIYNDFMNLQKQNEILIEALKDVEMCPRILNKMGVIEKMQDIAAEALSKVEGMK